MHRLPEEIDADLAALVRAMVGFEIVVQMRNDARRQEMRRVESWQP